MSLAKEEVSLEYLDLDDDLVSEIRALKDKLRRLRTTLKETQTEIPRLEIRLSEAEQGKSSFSDSEISDMHDELLRLRDLKAAAEGQIIKAREDLHAALLALKADNELAADTVAGPSPESIAATTRETIMTVENERIVSDATTAGTDPIAGGNANAPVLSPGDAPGDAQGLGQALDLENEPVVNADAPAGGIIVGEVIQAVANGDAPASEFVAPEDGQGLELLPGDDATFRRCVCHHCCDRRRRKVEFYNSNDNKPGGAILPRIGDYITVFWEEHEYFPKEHDLRKFKIIESKSQNYIFLK
jgi:hypothetical protein